MRQIEDVETRAGGELLAEEDVETALPRGGLIARTSECCKRVDAAMLDTCLTLTGVLVLLNGRFGPQSERCSYLASKGQSVVDYIAVDVCIFSCLQDMSARRQEGARSDTAILIRWKV